MAQRYLVVLQVDISDLAELRKLVDQRLLQRHAQH